MIYRDQDQYRVAFESWQRERLLFDAQEAERLARLQRKRFADSPIIRWLSLPAIGLAVAAGVACRDFGIFFVLFFLEVLLLNWVDDVFQRLVPWRYRDELVRRTFAVAQPVYEQPAYSSPPPRREQTSSAPPPRTRPEPPKPEPPEEIRVTSLQQAYGILGLAPGRTTLSEARAIYRHKIAMCHPDLTMRLDKELQALAARKTLALNLALQFIETHTK